MTATVAETLRKAADLIEPKGAWTQGYYARDASGRYWEEDPDSDAQGSYVDFPAKCFCLYGAIAKAVGADDPFLMKTDGRIEDALRLATGTTLVADWNDAPERTQAEVVAALRAAADASEAP